MKRFLCHTKYLSIFIFFTFFIMPFISCASKPKFEGKGDLCGLVLDENNSPVKDFVIYCKPASNNLAASAMIIKPVITNESGIFIFYDLPSGQYKISGEKINYLKLENVNYKFNDRTKILCLQTKGFRAVLMKAEEYLRLRQKEAASQILENFVCEQKSKEERIIYAYLFFAQESKRQKKKMIKRIKKENLEESDFFKNYITKLEEAAK